MADTTFVSKVTNITVGWLQDVNNFIYRNIGASSGSSLVGFTSASGVVGTVSGLAVSQQIGDYSVNWVPTVSSGVYSYLGTAASVNIRAQHDAIGLTSAVRSSTGAGSAGTANIAYAAFAYNDSGGSLPSVWGYYSTVIRKSGTNGSTHGMEIDVANMGSTIAITPANMFLAGLTDCLWICTGGETATSNTVGSASCAMAIVRNDANVTPSASFNKGIVFHNVAISGTDGATGNGIAIAFATRHQQIWYNNSNQACGEFVCNTQTVGNALRVDLNDFGLLVQDRASGGTNFQVQNTTSAANYMTALAGTAGNSPSLVANGAGTDLDIQLTPKGAGYIKITNTQSFVANGSVATVLGSLGPAGSHTTVQGWLTYKDNSGALRYIPTF